MIIIDSNDLYEFKIGIDENGFKEEEILPIPIDSINEVIDASASNAVEDNISINDVHSVVSVSSDDDNQSIVELNNLPKKRVKVICPPPQSYVGKNSKDLMLGLVRYIMSVSTVIVNENFIEYLKYLLRVKNRLSVKTFPSFKETI